MGKWLLIAVLTAVPFGADATDIIVRVSGIVGSAGTIRVAACLPEEYATQNCLLRAHAPARPGEMNLLIRNVPPGSYAIIAHHDWRDEGKVHTNWLGIPVEGVGVSRNAGGRFGPPPFADVALSVTGPRVAVDITLRREPDP
jgi:uncharacterized protein (DUF2141 family)